MVYRLLQMTSRPDTDDYLALFLNDTPLMDVRAPVEFTKGSFPLALNAPLMNDEERHRVGICYKDKGQEQAIVLGHQLVSGDIKAARIDAWKRFALQNPDGYLFCFRGGLRSRLTQQWLRDAGIEYPLIAGGYKALRRFLIDQLEAVVARETFTLVSGRTGTGKTRLLNNLPNSVDLEGIANHRGSSFGRQITPQPTQIDFENRLSIALLKTAHQPHKNIVLEDEGHLVGRCCLPESLRVRMMAAPMMVLERPIEERIAIIKEDYVVGMISDFIGRDGEEAGWLNFRDYLLSALERLRKRLGGGRYADLKASMEAALESQRNSGDLGGHDAWIQALLKDYYDPMYDYQLSQKQGRVVVIGSPDTLLNWAQKLA